MTEDIKIDNPYWDKLSGFVSSRRHPTWGTFTIDCGGGIEAYTAVFKLRRELIPRYTWTITAPRTVQMVAGHCTQRVIDPMAGTGYWGYLLGQLGVQVISTDICPPDETSTDNPWHPQTKTWTTVLQADAADAAMISEGSTTLLLSWPPCDDPIGFTTLSAFAGNRVIYIGEGAGGATGDDNLHHLLKSEWNEYATHDPVQYDGIHDYVTVFHRNQPLA